MSQAVFAIVEFKKTNTTGIVPVKWLTMEEDVCFWPKGLSGAKGSKLAEKLTDVCPDWERLSVQVMGKAGMYFCYVKLLNSCMLNLLI